MANSEDSSQRIKPEHSTREENGNNSLQISPLKIKFIDQKADISEEILIDSTTCFANFLGILCDVSASVNRQIPDLQFKKDGFTLTDGPWWYRICSSENTVDPYPDESEWLVLDSTTAYNQMMNKLTSGVHHELTAEIQHDIQKSRSVITDPLSNSGASSWPFLDQPDNPYQTPTKPTREMFRTDPDLDYHRTPTQHVAHLDQPVHIADTTMRDSSFNSPVIGKYSNQPQSQPGTFIGRGVWSQSFRKNSNNFSHSAVSVPNQQMSPFRTRGPTQTPNTGSNYVFYQNNMQQPHTSVYPDLESPNTTAFQPYNQVDPAQYAPYVQDPYAVADESLMGEYRDTGGVYQTEMYNSHPNDRAFPFYPQMNWQGHSSHGYEGGNYQRSRTASNSSNFNGLPYSSSGRHNSHFTAYPSSDMASSNRASRPVSQRRGSLQRYRHIQSGQVRQPRLRGNGRQTQVQQGFPTNNFGYPNTPDIFEDDNTSSVPTSTELINPEQYYRHPSIVARNIRFGQADIVQPSITIGPHHRPRSKTGIDKPKDILPNSAAVFAGMDLARKEKQKVTSSPESDYFAANNPNKSTAEAAIAEPHGQSLMISPSRSAHLISPALPDPNLSRAAAKLEELKTRLVKKKGISRAKLKQK